METSDRATEDALCIVTITTTLDAEYTFPDVPKRILLEIAGRLRSKSVGDLTLVNVSGACLMIRREIIKFIKCNQEVVWSR